MDHVDELTTDELRTALAEVDEKTPTLRLVAAIAYKNNVTQTALADWFGVERKTIYNWLDRLDADALPESAIDDPRPGRPRKLRPEQQLDLVGKLRGSPVDVGLESTDWTARTVRTYLHEEHDLEYSLPTCRRLLAEFGPTEGSGREG